MLLDETEKSYIWDIIDAINDILAFTEQIDFSYFERDKMRRFAVERQLLVIGEAANHLSKETRDLIPGVPWPQMIGLRNIIAHKYGEILTERIWSIAKNNIASVKSNLEELL